MRGPKPATGALDLFASCAPGLEPLLAAEVAALGLSGQVVPGGVELTGDPGALARLNLWLRTASRVLVRLGSVRATSFAQLVHEAGALPFERVLAKGTAVDLRVTCRKSKLYHSEAVAERLHAAIEARLGRTILRAKPAQDADANAGADADADISQTAPTQLLLARFERDVCTVSADASGELLHRRGYRVAVSRAPLRETLAAALLLAAGFDGALPLIDPLCGSGTIALEAALIARRRAPGIARTFAFQRWPDFDAGAFAQLVIAARAQELPRAPALIAASDLDAGAIAAARENARRAGLDSDVLFEQRGLADLTPRAGPGLCATNPPYGKRVGAAGAGGGVATGTGAGAAMGAASDAEADLHQLWRALGDLLRTRLPGFSLAVLSPDPRLAKAARLTFRTLLRTQNGGLPIDFLSAPTAAS